MDTLYLIFGIAVLALVCAVCLAFSGVRTGGRTVPEPPEHLRPKGSVPRMINPPAAPKKKDIPYFNGPLPPIVNSESMKLSFENWEKAQKALDKMKLNQNKN